MAQHDVIVVGAGMAGASAAYELAAHGSVLILEREAHPGRHTTGRSAALYTETYGNAVIRRLSFGSRPFLDAPPSGFAAQPLLTPRGRLHLARADQSERLDANERAAADLGVPTRRVAPAEMAAMVPLLRPDYAAAGLFEPGAADIDVDALHQGYLRGARARGAELRTDAEVAAVEHSKGAWRLRIGAEEHSAAVLINAAGAWADTLARQAGVREAGLRPLRRTVVLLDPPPGVAVHTWPAVTDADERFYFKPDAGLILASPADETPSDPCDAAPEEIDIATAVDRVQQAIDLPVHRVRRAWAGLRTFASDRTPVVGYDPEAPGFFWLAGQGGYGIQTAPALARLSAALVLRGGVPDDLQALGVEEAALSPGRSR